NARATPTPRNSRKPKRRAGSAPRNWTRPSSGTLPGQPSNATRQEDEMKSQTRKSLIAAAVLALIGSPVWAAGASTQTPAGTPQAGSGTQMEHPAVDTPDAAATGLDSTGTPQAESGAMMEHPALAATNPIYARTPDELKDAKVID